MDVVALLSIRNDAPYAANCLRGLIAEGLGIAVIDNGSTDDLHEILARPDFRAHVVDYTCVRFRGSFELARISESMDEVAARLEPDWLVYVDADEVLHSYEPGERVADVLAAADADGCDVVGSDEFVFLPLDHDYVSDLSGWQPMLHYYFYEPRPLHLMQACRRDALPRLAASGAHRVFDSRRLYARRLVNRHYIFRSASHAREKYAGRRYPLEELRRGWHIDRVGFEPEAFAWPDASRLRTLPSPDSRQFDRSQPWRRHYWQPRPRLRDRARGRLRGVGRELVRLLPVR